VKDFETAGARLAVIGSGWPAMAKSFAERTQLPASMLLLCDPKLESFQAAGLHRSVLRTLNPLALLLWVRALLKGHRQGKQAGDNFQQGGSLVVARGGEVLLRTVSQMPGHHPSPAKLLGALSAA
jgi:hypothetical protein